MQISREVFSSAEFISFHSSSRENVLQLNQSVVMHLNHKLAHRRYLRSFLSFFFFLGWKVPNEFQLCGVNEGRWCAGTSWIRSWWIRRPGHRRTAPCCSSAPAGAPSSSSSSCPTRTTPSPTATSSWRSWRDSTLISKMFATLLLYI